MLGRTYSDTCIGSPLEQRAMDLLHCWAPYWDEPDISVFTEQHFKVTCDYRRITKLIVADSTRNHKIEVPRSLFENPDFNIAAWYEEYLYLIDMHAEDVNRTQPSPLTMDFVAVAANKSVWSRITSLVGKLLKADRPEEHDAAFVLNGIQVDRNKYPHLQRNAVVHKTKKASRLPKSIIVTVKINGQLARALLDSGSLGDFISSTLADQFKLKREKLEVPLTVQLAVQGSRSKIAVHTEVRLQYQGIDETRSLDVININSYDLILGTP